MPLFNSSLITSAAADSTPADPVTRSLRFDTNGKLSRTFGTPNSKKTFTLAFWVKRAGFSSSAYKEIWQYDRGGRGGGMGFSPTQSNWMDEEEFQFSSRNANTGVADVNIALTTRFRDPAAWMHIALVVDTTLGSSEAADRIKIFVNNERNTNYDTSHTHSYYWPVQNYEFSEIFGGTGAPQNIGLRDTNNHPLNGYLADIYFIDGAAIEPDTNFIESTGYGSYKPKAFDMSSYSGNSFHIDAQPAHDADLLVSSVSRNDGDTTFVDAAKGHTLTTGGDPEHSIAVGNPFTGDDRAIYFDGSDDNLVVTSDSSFNEFGTGDFTIEMWVNPADQGSGSFAQMFELYGSTSDRMYLRIERQSSQNVYKFVVNGSDSFDVESDSAPDYGSWQHLAVVRNGTSITMYVDGTAQTDSVTISSSASYSWPSRNLKIAKGNSSLGSGAEYGGYIFDYRITKGTAQYTSNFTPPTSKLSDDSSSLLLQPTKTDTSIGDSSSNSHTVTTASSPTITASTPYDAAAKSTAMYFDGNGDTIVAAASSDFAFGTGDFTVEGWWYFESIPSDTDAMLVDFRPNNNNDTDTFAFSTDTTNGVKVYSGGNYVLGGSLSTNTWHHIALVRDSGTLYAYIDGTATGTTASFSSNLTANSTPRLGTTADGGLSAVFTGYIFDVRITKGTARYTSSFSSDLPSAPFELNPVYIGADQSGNKNHFTPTNISSHDVIPDTPTKNYATLNPLSKSSGGGLAEGNLKVPFGGTYPSNVLGSIGVSSGKWYWEVYLEGGSSANGHSCGVAVPEWANKNSDPEGTSTPYSHYVDSRSKFVNNGSATSNSTTISPQDIIGVALNADDDEISFYKNGSIIGSAQSLEANQTWMPFHKNSSYTSLTQWVNFGQDPTFAGNKTSGQDTSQSEFYYAPPNDSDGNPFKSLNTSNLAAPTVTPSEHFNSMVYQGASPSDKAVTGVGFQPDLVWIKARTQTYNHAVYDSVRGATEELHPNTTDAEDTDSNGLKTFDSDGFTVGSDGEVGDPTGTRISWNWKAHQGTSSGSSSTTTYTVKVEDSSNDAWDDGSHYDFSTYLPSPYMEIFENRNGTLVSLGEVAVRTYDSSGVSMSDTGEQTYTLECADLDAIAVKWHYDTSADGDEYDYPNSYNGYLNEQAITILDGSTSEWGTNNYSNDDGTSYNYSPPTGWADGDTLKSATTSYNGSDTATLTSSGSASDPVEKYNDAAGFTIIKYTGDSAGFGSTQTLNHSLSVPLDFVIAKARTNHQSTAGGNWVVWHKDLSDYEFLVLNSNASKKTDYYSYEIIEPTVDGTQHQVTVNNGYDGSSNYYLNLGSSSGSTPEEYILYGWAGVENFSKFGTFEGNGLSDGPFIYTGFRPRFIMIKSIDDAYAWYIHDTARSPYNYSDNELVANTSGQEYSVSGEGGGERLDILSNGFKHRTSNSAMNQSSRTHIYAAFAESPFSKSNAR